ncbi:uncharacterized protein GGS22DRAFT_185463 [Annulohypoxylon maeteangense]|uniref:uncharacterized protein n=1 Tax=Annulohypoxylon maeteangense TaxID=1927788 RepID=UPI002007D168|nr:uncharacterized protein GGS22DRAFT_185463 [Annulohypoxylon maeteangense]KAI0888083.1 hypothetical protein GGS22DRAFT_185463 [Annulohypoxylon maeteangense]
MPETHPKNQIVLAPSTEPYRGIKSVFLAGTTTKTDDRDWREVLAESLLDLPVTVINPYRPDWDSSWKEDITCDHFRRQVEWELEKQDGADMVVFYFHPATEAPISLLELGLCARAKKAIVVCPEGYKKRGNVQIVCRTYGLETVESLDALKPAIARRLPNNFS